MHFDHRQVKRIKEQYPSGTHILLVSMTSGKNMPDGLQGSVDFVDDMGQIHVLWDNGSTLALNPGEDSLWIISQSEPGINMRPFLRSALEREGGLFYSDTNTALHDAWIGRLRGDFGYKGQEFWHTWFPQMDALVTNEFKDDLQEVVNALRKDGPLKNLSAMSEFCSIHPEAKISADSIHPSYGFVVETKEYQFFLRCFPFQGDYQFNIYVYDKAYQQMNMG